MNNKDMPAQITMTKWELEADTMTRRRVGKTAEECAELLAVLARISIQGIDAVDPASGKTNRQRMQEEIADVYAQLDECVSKISVDNIAISNRRTEKRRQMLEWEQLYQEHPFPNCELECGGLTNWCKCRADEAALAELNKQPGGEV